MTIVAARKFLACGRTSVYDILVFLFVMCSIFSVSNNFLLSVGMIPLDALIHVVHIDWKTFSLSFNVLTAR